MKKISILYVIKSLGRGGAEILLLDTIKHLDKQKFEVYVVFFLPWKNNLVNAIENEGAKVINLSAKNNLAIILSYRKIAKLIVQNEIDIVHSHLPWASFSCRVALAFNKRVKHIYTEHNLQERYHFITKLINKISYKLIDKVICVSKSVEDSINKNIGEGIPSVVIVNGVNCHFFSNDAIEKKIFKKHLNIPETCIVIGNVCVFREQKRLYDWINIFEKIYNNNPTVFGILIGSGKLFEPIEKYIKEKNLSHRIILPGLQKNVKQFYNIIDIFLITSEFEGLPIALLEAMSMECFPASSNAGGIVDVINETNGLKVDKNDVYELVPLLNSFIEQPNQLKPYQKNARITIEKEFDIQITVKKIESTYHKSLSL